MTEPEQKGSVASEPVQVQPVVQEAKVPLLRDETGTALPIFVDPNELDSARLCRTIKKHGGVNARQPGQAKMILVKNDAYTGLQFVRDWSDSVATLDYRWLEKCITQGRVLGEADDWAGCLLKHDGKPILPPTMDGEGPSTHVEISPLPTPRQTPPVVIKRSDSVPAARDHTPSASGRNSRFSPGMPPPINFSDAPSQPTASTSSQPVPSEPSTFHAPATPNTPNTMMNLTASQNMPIPQSQDMNYNQMMFMQYLAFSNPAMFSGFQQQQPMFGMANGMPGMPNGIPGMPNGIPGMPNGMPGMLPPNDTSTVGMPMMNGMTPNMFMPGMFNPMAMGIQTGMPGMADMSISMHGFSESHTGLPDASVPTPKIEPSSSPLPKKGANSRVVKKKSKSRDKETPRSSEQPSASTSRVSTPSRPHTPAKIFDAGRTPKTFFVELGIHRRSELTSIIKKNGGVIVSAVEKADYVILNTQEAKDTVNFMARAVLENIPTLSAKFVKACVAAGEIVDYTDYLIEVPSSIKVKREKQDRTLTKKPESSSSSWKTSTTSVFDSKVSIKLDAARKTPSKATLKEKQKQQAGPSKAPESKDPTMEPPSIRRKSVKREGSPIDRDTWPDDLRSPSPPGEHTRVIYGGGKYRFTDEEKDYAQKYAAILYRRDPEMSNQRMAKALYKKMPNHPVGSWQNHVMVEYNQGTYSILQRRGGVDFRKRAAKSASTSAPPPPDEEKPSIPSSSLKKQKVSHASTLEDDINTVVDFFVNGGDALEGDDESIWANLTAQTTCKSMATWAEFHAQHHVVIKEKYDAL
ncbi:hypothetical protein BDZ89DRAFT_1109164, partial [Hymenopellis radicata]